MRWLIIGAKGNLGAQLVQTIEGQVVAWDYPEIDLTNSLELRQSILNIAPDVIVNAAAYNAVDKCQSDSKELDLAWKLNRILVDNLAQTAQDLGAVFVHFSTDYVFAGDQVKGYTETDKPEPINMYGKTKLAGETAILQRQNLKYYIIRTSKLFGPPGSGEFCKPSFFNIMLDLANKGKEISVIDGEVSCFTYTKDLAEITQKIVKNNLSYGIYHVVNSSPVTWYQAAKYLFDISGVSVKVKAITAKDYPRPAVRPKFSVLNNTKLPGIRSWQTALQDYLKN